MLPDLPRNRVEMIMPRRIIVMVIEASGPRGG
jgi:hypothetical protein